MSVKRVLGVVGAGVLLLAFVGVAHAAAATMPLWQVTAGFAPTNLRPGGEGQIVVIATNLGDAEANGASPNTPVSVTDKLPPGLEATAISGSAGPEDFRSLLSGASVECVQVFPACTYAGPLPPYEFLEMTITVRVVGAVLAENEVSVTGGGAKSASATQPVRVSTEPTRFGIEDYELSPTNENGSLDMQAGSHPFQLTTTLAVNKTQREGHPAAAGLTQDLRFRLPPGLIGNPTALPQCTAAEFDEGGITGVNGCPASTAVGVATPTAIIPEAFVGKGEPITLSVPLFNLVASVGEPARFGFDILGVRATVDTSVRTGGDYGVTLSANNISQAGSFMRVQTTFWGVPGDPRHDNARGWNCVFIFTSGGCTPQAQQHPAPFLTLPTSCARPLETTVEGESWPAPAKPSVREDRMYTLPEALTGCNRLSFSPSIEVAPDGEAASTPTGLTVGMHVPQEISLNPEGVAEVDVKDTTVALPAGLQLSPSGGNGLEACSDAQIGFKGENPQTETDEFTPSAPSCPNGSKIATVKIKTPLLPNPLEGAVYLAAPQNFAGPPLENPFGSLIAMYLVAEDPVSGVLVKLPGKVVPNSVTGQLVTTFENTPQLPFEDLELHFFGGERAPLSTPASCGSYTTQASFTPWSGNAAVEPSSSFDITSGPNGAPCPDPRPFAPGFQAGSTNLQAGAFTPFTTTMTRPDADQTLGRIEMQIPAGLSGTLSNVKLCGEPQAAQGTCGPESEIGETVVSAGLGNDPYTVTGGKVYITTAYGGGNYGLSIVNPASAGPFVLDEGRPIVVRAAIFVDPHTAALRVLSEPLPTILDGIPLQLQHVYVNINRPGFTFNPTNCASMAITGTISSSQGAAARVSTPFQVANCATLAFKPKFAASTSGKTSKTNGASLTVKLTYPNTPQGTEANVAKVKVDLPKQLPSRLTTLQKACTAAVFDANPAGCPAASIVGHARAITPIIPVPLEGPAYFVSHGGEAFPSLIFVLQGYGVTEDLVGTTFISKAGITSSTFKAVPDVPIGTFELTLPQEPYSALAANLPAADSGSFCGQKLALPTAFVAQNGAEIHESTPLSVSGCKPAITVVKHSVKGGTATIVVSVPAAGRLVATGSGLSRASGKASKAGTVTVKLTLTKGEAAFLAKHHGRKLRAKINLRFTPRKGSRLTTSVTVLIG